MRAVVAREPGEPGDVLQVRRLPIPEPGPGQVLVRVAASPVHASDLHTIRGRYGFTPEFPAVVGQECTGTIAAVRTAASGAGGLQPGQRVITVGVLGTWQEYLVADADRVLAVPDSLTTSTASQLLINPLTAWLLLSQLGLREGDRLLQTAAGSTVGRLVLQLAAHLGLQTINVVRRRAAVEPIRALGGTEVICTEDEDLVARLAQLTADRPLTRAIDCVAGQVGADVSRALTPGGELVVYGALSTHRQTDPSALTIPLFARSVIYEAKVVRGFWLHHWLSTTPAEQARTALGTVVDLVGAGILTVAEGQPFPAEQAAEAARLAEAPAGASKPLLTF